MSIQEWSSSMRNVPCELQLQISLLKSLLTSSFIPLQIFGTTHSAKCFLPGQLYLDSNAFSTRANPTSSVTDSRWQSLVNISLTFLVILWALESFISHNSVHSSVALRDMLRSWLLQHSLLHLLGALAVTSLPTILSRYCIATHLYQFVNYFKSDNNIDMAKYSNIWLN